MKLISVLKGKILISGAFLLFVSNAGAQSVDRNYIRTYDVQIEGVSDPSILTINTPASTALQTIKYFDGLGRPSQIVSVRTSPSGNDIVQPVTLNALDRDENNMLSYEATTGVYGSYRPDFKSRQSAFYQNLFQDSYGKSPAEYDNSPLSRIMKQGSAGDKWQLDATDHYISYQRLSNQNSNPFLTVKLWSVTGNTCTLNGNYPNNQLFVSLSTDENGAQTYEFTDKTGTLILNRRIVSGVAADTYFVYDDMGLLRFVISPEGSSQITGSFNIASEPANYYTYFYSYDTKRRLASKKVPGKNIEYFIYNDADQLILYQDGKMRSSSPFKWEFIKYDASGREIMSGITTQFGSNTPDMIYTDMEIAGAKCYEILYSSGYNVKNNYYSNNAFPLLQEPYVLNKTSYYDTYTTTFIGSTIPDLICNDWPLVLPSSSGTMPVSSPYQPNVNGEVTVSHTFVEDMNTYFGSVVYYDKFNRPTRVSEQHHLAGFSLTTTTYKGLTALPESCQNYIYAYALKGTPGSYMYQSTEDIVNSYDAAGRILSTAHTFSFVNGQQPLTLNVIYTYNPAGTVTSKVISNENGVIQTIDYQYNIKGWLTKINNPNDLSPGNDAFGMELLYETQDAILQNPMYYDGNISGIKWQTPQPSGTILPVTTGIKAYAFGYDELNQLRSAKFFEMISGTLTKTNKYTESANYDLNGNITSLCRYGRGSAGVVDQLTYYYKGNQLIGVNDQIAPGKIDIFTDGGQTGIPNPSNISTWEMTYDNNGNMLQEKNRGLLSIAYNTLNLPVAVNKSGGIRIEYQYDALGRKCRQICYTNGTATKTTDFINNFVFENGTPSYLIYDEGRIVKQADGTYYAEVHVKDHLGNVRAACKRTGANVEITQVNSYYPFGHNIKDLTQSGATTGSTNEYLFNGKMAQDEIGSGWLDYGARFYDAMLGRWSAVDPLSDKYLNLSPYAYCANNPVMLVDPDGKSSAPLYDTDGNFLGTDDKGLKGLAIIMEKTDYKQGMSHSDALSKSKGYEGLKTKEAKDKFNKHYDNLPSRPDYDGYLTFDDALKWSNQGNGQPLFVDGSQIDLSPITVNDVKFAAKYKEGYIDFFGDMRGDLNTGRVYGNIKVTLICEKCGLVKLGGKNGYLDLHDYGNWLYEWIDDISYEGEPQPYKIFCAPCLNNVDVVPTQSK